MRAIHIWKNHEKRTRTTLFLVLNIRLFSNHPISAPAASAAAALNIAIISGSTRTHGPPHPILGPRVNHFLSRTLKKRGHDISLVDPIAVELPLLQKPHFAYAKSRTPEVLASIHEKIVNADCYVMITPEYNHSPSPGLMNVLNHFGSSSFGFKPSAIVSYSAGQWGGTRAAQALRPFLSELGCLPVSAMVHIPKVQEVLDDDGRVIGDEDEEQKWDNYVSRSLSQLEWWGEATKRHRGVVDPNVVSPIFDQTPSQRNAPK